VKGRRRLAAPACIATGIAACIAAGIVACVAACAAPDGATAQRDPVVAIPMTDAAGQSRLLAARICRPATDAPAPVVAIAHGSPPDAADRPRMALASCATPAARWFLARGYIVVVALRRGYGATGGAWAEGAGRCADGPDYARAGIETARDMDAVIAYATALPYARPDGAVVVGQSAGGWGAIAYDSLPHPRVGAFVVMAGGRGGHQDDVPNRNCRPDLLARAAGQYGATATTPMLWIYAANDSFFAPPIARAMHAAFTAAGGSAVLDQVGPYDGDGHRLFFGHDGSAVWGTPVAQYLDRQGVAVP
jgi:pimeloyl-ACP methyl ester carboxylesterase